MKETRIIFVVLPVKQSLNKIPPNIADKILECLTISGIR